MAIQDRMTLTAELCRKFSIASLYVFGSQAVAAHQWVIAGGKAHSLLEGSDLDVGVKLLPNQSLTTMRKVALAQALEILFEVARVDLVSLDEADPFLAAEIIRGERLYAYDTHAADEYELYVLRRAGDLAPFERARQKLILEGQRP